MSVADVSAARGAGAGRSLATDLWRSLKAPEFWTISSWLDIVVRYRQSRLGIFWMLVPSFAYIWGIGAFFATMRSDPLSHFVAHVAIGYAIFRLVHLVLNDATSAFAAASSFILDGRVRLTDFVLRVLAKALFFFAMSLPAVALALFVAPELHAAGFALALLSFPLVLANALWIAVVFALVGARLPDLTQLVGTVFMFAFLLTPIIWDAAMMPPDSVRGMFVRFNPLFHMIEIVRAPILGHAVEPLTLWVMIGMTVAGWALAAFAYRRYARFVPLWI